MVTNCRKYYNNVLLYIYIIHTPYLLKLKIFYLYNFTILKIKTTVSDDRYLIIWYNFTYFTVFSFKT
jgi:hypothetical protein